MDKLQLPEGDWEIEEGYNLTWDVPKGATRVASDAEMHTVMLFYPDHGWFDLCNLGGYDTLDEVEANLA
jgi:hypothetical protein